MFKLRCLAWFRPEVANLLAANGTAGACCYNATEVFALNLCLGMFKTFCCNEVPGFSLKLTLLCYVTNS